MFSRTCSRIKTCSIMTQRKDFGMMSSADEDILRYSLVPDVENGTLPYAEAFFTTKAVGRDPEMVCKKLGVGMQRFARPHQVHGVVVRQIAEEFFALPERIRNMLLDGVDAVIYDVRNACIGISTADCIPVVCYDMKHHCAAAIHAGWRGTSERIAIRAIEMMAKAYGTRAEELKTVIGPGISLQSFEVGEEVYNVFMEKGFDMTDCAERMLMAGGKGASSFDGIPWKWHIDLKKCNLKQLVAVGVSEENIIVSDVDTMTDLRCYSARREGAYTGRMLSGIILR